MAFWFVFDYEIFAVASGELGSAGLFGVKMVKARFPRKYFSVFCDL